MYSEVEIGLNQTVTITSDVVMTLLRITNRLNGEPYKVVLGFDAPHTIRIRLQQPEKGVEA